MYGTAEYGAWARMKDRCFNPANNSYCRYGALGITVCEDWRKSFENFFSHVGQRPSPEHSLDRYPDFSGNYEPGNVRWATATEQARNRKSNRIVTYRGVTCSIAEIAEIVGINASLLYQRMSIGFSIERAIEKGQPHLGFHGKHRLITLNGEIRYLHEWSKITGMSPQVISHRLDHGWSIEEALRIPVEKRTKRGHRSIGRPKMILSDVRNRTSSPAS